MPTNKPLTEDTLQLLAESYGDDRFLRLKDIVPAQKGAPGLVPFGRATLWLKVKAQTFPRPIKINRRLAVWRLSAIKAWVDAQQHAPLHISGGPK